MTLAVEKSVFPSNVNDLFREVEEMCRWGSNFPCTDLLQGVARFSRCGKVFKVWQGFQGVARFSRCGKVFKVWQGFQGVARFSSCGKVFKLWQGFQGVARFCRRLRKMATLDASLAPTPRVFCEREECHWPRTRPLKGSGHVCIGPARYKSLYHEEFAAPKQSDYAPAKTGGGWHRSASRQAYNPIPYKTDKSLYSVEFSRVKVPGQSDFQPLQKRVDPWLPKFPEEPEKKKDRCGIGVERDGPDGPPDFEDTLNTRGRCCHGDHKRYVSKAENPLRYPYSLFDPDFVDHNRHLTHPKIPENPYPKRVTEEDVRNNPPSGWKGAKGFFTPEPGGHSSELGVRAAGEYYNLVRPLEGTLLAMNANRSIKSRFMM